MKINKRKVDLTFILVVLISVLIIQSCNPDDECTRIDKIGGGLLPEREIEVPCDFPEAKPLEEI